MTDRYQLELLDPVPHATIAQHVNADGTLYATHGRSIYRTPPDGPRELIGKFPFVKPRDYFGLCRLSERAARADKCNIFVTPSGAVLAIRACTVYALDKSRLRDLFTIQGDSVLHGSICAGDDGWVYFGEYFMNPERGEVKIWRVSADLTTHEPACVFPAGFTRHVHGVYTDPHEPGTLWATLGDYEDECYFLRTTDGFRTYDRIGEGTQAWRCVRPFFTPTHVGWITDSHIDPNHAARFARSTGQLETGQSFPCSGWYGFQADGLCVASTTVERGPAITSEHASVYVSDDAFNWHEAGYLVKDFYRPMRVFKYGVIAYPSGDMSADDFYISGEGLVGLDGKTRRARIVRGPEGKGA